MEKRVPNSSTSTTSTAMFCNNCGGKGHLFRTCKDPVLSCGLLLIDQDRLPVDPTSNVRVLMVRRKDSMSYAEFMRGKYDPTNEEYVSTLFRNMTIKEQASIACEPFDTLWRNLWGDERSCSDYSASKEKFESLQRIKLMSDNLSSYTEPEWTAPKGRRMRGESDLDCAIREFNEETNIPRDAYIVLKNMILEETFTGLNFIRYRHVYFVAILKHPERIDITQKFTPMQRREISSIAWKTIPEAQHLARPHHIQRKEMLEQLTEIVKTFEAE